jgi:D-alanine-D-alanine ligase
MNAAALGKVAVLHGGWSAEREVSLESGRHAQAALQRRGVDSTLIDASPNVVLNLKRDGYARVFIALHGRGGEDGQVQAALELQGLAYTGSRVAASALAMNKRMTKQVWASTNIPSPASLTLAADFDAKAVVTALGLPIFVKPASEGSSIGMSKVTRVDQLAAAYAAAAPFDPCVLAERFVDGAEYTAAILNGRALPLIRVQPQAEFYDYHAKYVAEDTGYHCPCGLPAEEEQALQALCLKAFFAVGAQGWGRVDFFIDKAGAPWCLEVNTVPGLTSHSLVPMAARAAGLDFDELIWQILLSSVEAKA